VSLLSSSVRKNKSRKESQSINPGTMMEFFLNAPANLEVSFPTISPIKLECTLDSTVDYKDNEDHEVSFWAD